MQLPFQRSSELLSKFKKTNQRRIRAIGTIIKAERERNILIFERNRFKIISMRELKRYRSKSVSLATFQLKTERFNLLSTSNITRSTAAFGKKFIISSFMRLNPPTRSSRITSGSSASSSKLSVSRSEKALSL